MSSRQLDVYLSQLTGALDALDAMDLGKALRAEDAEEASFGKRLPDAERVREFLLSARDTSFDFLDEQIMAEIVAAANAFLTVLDESRKMSTQDAANRSHRNGFEERFRNAVKNVYTTVTPYVAYARTGSADSARRAETAQKDAARVSAARAEAEAVLLAMQKAAAETGVEVHANLFSTQAGKHTEGAKVWLIVASLLGALTAVAAWLAATGRLLVPVVTAELTTPQGPEAVWQLLAGKVLLFSVLYFGVLFAAKNYRAHRHNALINKHRSNALQTFQTFVKSTESAIVRDQVLLAATEAIFAGATTGYLGKEQEQSSTPVLGMIRQAVDR